MGVFTGVGIFAYLGVRKLISDDWGFGNGYKGLSYLQKCRWSWAWLLWPWTGLTSPECSFSERNEMVEEESSR